MRWILAIALLALVANSSASVRAADDDGGLLLASDGKSTMPIVIAARAMNATEDYKWGYFCPTTGERQVAFELAEILERMTGATFDVHALGATWSLVARDDKSTFGVVSPRGLATDAAGRVYVVEDGNPGTMTVFDNSGGGRAVVALQSTGSLHWPSGIDIDARGTIAVAVRTEVGKGEIQLFDPQYRFVARVSLDEHGGCSDVAFDANANLWVAVTRNLFASILDRIARLALPPPLVT